MRTVRRLLYKDIIGSVVMVALAFLSLFFFIDFVEEVDRMSPIGAGSTQAALLAAMELPWGPCSHPWARGVAGEALRCGRFPA